MVQLALAPARSGTGDKGMTMRISRRVVSRDGTGLAVWEAGDPDGRPILLLHGFSQCAMCFAAQAAYDGLVPAFEALFERGGRDFARFYDAVRALAAMPREERHARLRRLVPDGTAVASSGAHTRP